MVDNLAEEVLNHIPKRTPTWALGVVTVVVAITTSLVTMWVFSKDEIRQHITWTENYRTEEATDENSKEEKALDSVLVIVRNNMEQITELNKALVLAQSQVHELMTRVDLLENALSRIKGSLSNCEESLKNCEKRGK